MEKMIDAKIKKLNSNDVADKLQTLESSLNQIAVELDNMAGGGGGGGGGKKKPKRKGSVTGGMRHRSMSFSDILGDGGAEEEKKNDDVDPVQIGDLIFLEDADSFGTYPCTVY